MSEHYSHYKTWIVSVDSNGVPGVIDDSFADNGTTTIFEYTGQVDNDDNVPVCTYVEQPSYVRGFVYCAAGEVIVDLVQGSGINNSYDVDGFTGYPVTLTAGGADILKIDEIMYGPALKITFTKNAAAELDYFVYLMDKT